KHEKDLTFWMSEPDKGLYDAMNKGVQKANGDYVLFLGADDCLYAPETIAEMVKRMNPQSDLVYGDFVAVYRTFEKVKYAQPLTNLPKQMCFSHQALLTRRTLQQKYPFDLQYKIAADFDFIYKCFQAGYTFEHIPIFVARFNARGISAKKVVLGYQEVYRIVQKYPLPQHLHLFHRFRIFKQQWIVWLETMLGEENFEKLMRVKYKIGRIFVS
ncbi:MAG: glycosyltransferase, partial [Flammeovirgaceae bacterium]|nr:glycosyltransferase [Flammeovirgaceae bacterium]MDW8288455.1 glycosyltransferase [Flammeovirgaceae bacterium]